MKQQEIELFKTEGKKIKKATKLGALLFASFALIFFTCFGMTLNFKFLDFAIIFVMGICLMFNNLKFNTEYKVQKTLRPKEKNLFYSIHFWKINLFSVYTFFATLIYFVIDLLSLVSIKISTLNGVEMNYKYLTLSIAMFLIINSIRSMSKDFETFNKSIQ